MFKGAFTALVTPFSDGQIDTQALRDHVDFQIEKGIDGLVPCGTTGEASTLSHDEHIEVVHITVEHAAGRVPVIAGSGSNSTAEALELTKKVKETGADACLMITPYYNKPTQEGLFQHFSTIAEKVDIPIILYNVPGRTGINMLPDTVARLAAVPNIVGLKDAAADLKQTSFTRQLVPDDFVILSGEDTLVYPLMAVGASGVISVTSNILPGEMAELCRRFLEGNMAGAAELHHRLLPMCDALFVETNPIPVKAALAMMGRMKNELRLPLVPITDKGAEVVRRAITKFGLL
ncbi:MAG: 4-hydroxy-tetrahydrodipicolinate synthase [bacterium]|nr:4-hydroxy-tetrahydrodipicolinate synthase [bacterium]MDT8366837.1 4-hydroxy-tetrahydrodipicolinate synthase [bacterium]